MSGRAPIQSGRCWFVCSDELQYNQADVCLYVRTSSNTIRQLSVCMSGRAPIQSGRRGFESLAGSVLEEAQYNQAYELMNELHTIKQDRYITCSQKWGVHTCTSYVAKKVICYKMIHVSLLQWWLIFPWMILKPPCNIWIGFLQSGPFALPHDLDTDFRVLQMEFFQPGSKIF